jgi:8-amino-7-oxononanoate synthase
VDARSNDYLGLAAQGVSRETAVGRLGAGASRLISGTWPEHAALEEALAEWLGTEACLVFSSGYAANVGAVGALAGPGETVLSDALNHASIIDGCRLSRAEVVVLPHRDLGALERALANGHGVRWVVTESYFGMDGDSPDLAAMRQLCDAHDAALVVDEAHALGVFGPEGRGLCAERGVTADVLVGGLGKAFGIHGGFVASRRLYRDWLWNRARSFVFSTAPSPLLCGLTRERITQVRGAERERAQLRELESGLARALAEAGVQTPPGRHGPLFPIVLGSEEAVIAGAARARERGVLCHPIRPPTVPRGGSRLRVTLRADMSVEEVERIAEAMKTAWLERTEREEPQGAQVEDQPMLGGVPGLRERKRNEPEAVAADTPWSPTPIEPDAERRSVASPRQGEEPHRRGHARRDEHAGPKLDALPLRSRGAQLDVSSSGAPSSAAVGAGTPRVVSPIVRRWVILGTGTEVGKTFVARALVGALAHAGEAVAGLKPIETGLGVQGNLADATQLEALAFHVNLPAPHPLYGFADPVTPARAARAQDTTIDLRRIVAWVNEVSPIDHRSAHVVVETAGGVFSPLTDQRTNFDLAMALEPAVWILVAPNRLGVLHDVASTLHATTAFGRRPDYVILSAPETPDSSTSSNREELSRLSSMPPIIELPRNDPRPLGALIQAVVR